MRATAADVLRANVTYFFLSQEFEQDHPSLVFITPSLAYHFVVHERTRQPFAQPCVVTNAVVWPVAAAGPTDKAADHEQLWLLLNDRQHKFSIPYGFLDIARHAGARH